MPETIVVGIATVLYTIAFSVLTFSGGWLIHRAIKTKLHHVANLGIALILLSMSLVLVDLFNAPPVARSILGMNYGFFYLFFVKQAYYRQRKSAFVPLLAIMIVLRTLLVIETNVFGFSIPLRAPLPSGFEGVYFIHVSLVGALLVLPLAWLASAAIQARKHAGNVARKVTRRHGLVAVSAIVLASQAGIWFLIPTDGTGYTSPAGLVTGVLLLAVTCCHASLDVTCWVLPGLVPRDPAPGDAGATTIHADPLALPPTLHKPEIITIISLLGEELARMAGVTAGAAKGLLLTSIQADAGLDCIYELKLDRLLRTIAKTLASRLEALGVDDAAAKCTRLRTFLLDNQSILTMLKV